MVKKYAKENRLAIECLDIKLGKEVSYQKITMLILYRNNCVKTKNRIKLRLIAKKKTTPLFKEAFHQLKFINTLEASEYDYHAALLSENITGSKLTARNSLKVAISFIPEYKFNYNEQKNHIIATIADIVPHNDQRVTTLGYLQNDSTVISHLGGIRSPKQINKKSTELKQQNNKNMLESVKSKEFLNSAVDISKNSISETSSISDIEMSRPSSVRPPLISNCRPLKWKFSKRSKLLWFGNFYFQNKIKTRRKKYDCLAEA